MIVPTLATIVIGVQSLFDHVQEANNADRAYTLSVLSGQAGRPRAPVAERACRRDQAADRQPERETSRRCATSTKAAGRPRRQEQLPVRGPRSRTCRKTCASCWIRIETQLSELVQLRDQVGDLKQRSTTTDKSYSVLIQDLLQIRDLSASADR